MLLYAAYPAVYLLSQPAEISAYIVPAEHIMGCNRPSAVAETAYIMYMCVCVVCIHKACINKHLCKQHTLKSCWHCIT